jgi:Ca2+-binding EF-hand superfamily protein
MMKLHNLLKEKSRHSIRVVIVPLILLTLFLPPVAIARADDEAGSYTKDSCPLCKVGGMELTTARGSANTLECIYGSQDPDKPGAQVKYTRQEGPAETTVYDKYRDKRSTSDCVRSASGRMGCGTSFVLADQFKTEVTVYLPYPAKSSSAEKEAVKDKARALRDQLVACVKSSPPTKGAKVDEKGKLDGTIAGYDYGMRYLHLALQYDGKTYETTTDANGKFAFPVKIKKGEKYELTLYFEYLRDNKVFYRLLYRDKPDPVKLVLRIEDGAIIQSRIHLGTKEHIAWKPSDMSLKELRLEKLFDEPAINPLVTYVSTYIHMLEALTVYTDAFGEKLDFQLPIDVVLFSEEPTRYHYPPGKSRITFDNERSLHTCPARPVQHYHEFSHYVMHALYGGKWPAPMNPTVPEVNHGGYANPSTSDSFVEGFAHFMSILIHQELGDTIPHEKEGLMKSLNKDRMVCLEELETNYLAWDRGGKAEELAAAGVLWDLYDSKADYQPPAEAFELAYQSMLERYDVNKNGAMDYAEVIGMILMTKFSSLSVDEDYHALLNSGDLMSMFYQTGIARSKPGEPLDPALLNKYKDNDLLTHYDQHSRGALDLDELRVYVESANKNVKNPQHYAENLITLYDQNNDKMLGETELVRMLAGEEQCSGMVKKYDLNADAFIDISELIKIAEERGEALLDNIDPGELGALAPDGKIPQRTTLDDFVRQCQSLNRDDDDVEIPFQEIWAILRLYQQDFTAVYKSFVDKYPDKKKEIDEVFKAHGFFADVNPQNQRWNTREEIGPAADASTEERKSRRSIQPLPGQFIKVDNSVPYYDVAVVFPFQPHLSHVTRTSNDYGLVYVPVPPESYSAFVTVAAEGVKTKNPLTFSTNLFNATYEDSAKQGYFLEYEFALEGEIPVLPGFSFAASDSGSGSNVVLIIVVIAIIAAAAMPFILLRRKK